MKAYVLCVLVFAIGVGGQQRGAVEVRPVDEAVTVPDLLATRTAVIDALRRHDLEQLMTLMAEDVSQHGSGFRSDTAEKKRTNSTANG
jgi:hypothetical protein